MIGMNRTIQMPSLTWLDRDFDRLVAIGGLGRMLLTGHRTENCASTALEVATKGATKGATHVCDEVECVKPLFDGHPRIVHERGTPPELVPVSPIIGTDGSARSSHIGRGLWRTKARLLHSAA